MRTPVLLQPSWRGAAQCRKDNAVHFFAPAHFELKEERETREGRARVLCHSCPVRQACLDYSLAVQEQYGIWGGLNEFERRRTLRERAAAEAEPRSA